MSNSFSDALCFERGLLWSLVKVNGDITILLFQILVGEQQIKKRKGLKIGALY